MAAVETRPVVRDFVVQVWQMTCVVCEKVASFAKKIWTMISDTWSSWKKGEWNYEMREWALFRVCEYFWQVPTLRVESYWLRLRGWFREQFRNLSVEEQIASLQAQIGQLEQRLEKESNHAAEVAAEKGLGDLEAGGLRLQAGALANQVDRSAEEVRILRDRLARAQEARVLQIQMSNPQPLDQVLASTIELLDSLQESLRQFKERHSEAIGVDSILVQFQALQTSLLSALAQRQAEVTVDGVVVVGAHRG